jgi:hypothetical protein
MIVVHQVAGILVHAHPHAVLAAKTRQLANHVQLKLILVVACVEITNALVDHALAKLNMPHAPLIAILFIRIAMASIATVASAWDRALVVVVSGVLVGLVLLQVIVRQD